MWCEDGATGVMVMRCMLCAMVVGLTILMVRSMVMVMVVVIMVVVVEVAA